MLLVIKSEDHSHGEECIRGELPASELVCWRVPHTAGRDLDILRVLRSHRHQNNYLVPGDGGVSVNISLRLNCSRSLGDNISQIRMLGKVSLCFATIPVVEGEFLFDLSLYLLT